MPSRSQPGTAEPDDLQELVEFMDSESGAHGSATLTDLTGMERTIELGRITAVKGFSNVLGTLAAKGYIINYEADATVSRVIGKTPDLTSFSGSIMTCWSSNEIRGSRALVAAALMDDGTNASCGMATNVLNPDFVTEADPYIIVNAMPYLYVNWYWYFGRVIYWPYWWHDSHSHQGWFWSPYWYWRIYIKYYWYDVYYPWYWWWWHWFYWRHWYWWSNWFPYIW